MEEITPQAGDPSLREYLAVVSRRKTIILQTFVLVLVVGALVTFMSKPVYRTMARILVEGKEMTVTQLNANDPLSSLFLAPTSHDVSTQIEVLQSATLLTDAYQTSHVPPGSVHLDVKQIGQTDVIELTAESSNPGYAEILARTIPTTYLKYVTGNRRTEIDNALKFASNRYAEENTKLLRAELALQRFREQKHVANLETERAARISQSIAAEGDIRKAAAELAGLQARLQHLLVVRQTLAPIVETPTTATNTQIEVVKGQIETLKSQRAGLSVLWKPNSPKVQEVDAQIAGLEARLTQMPPTVTTTSTVPNPSLKEYDEKISDARSAVAVAQEALARTRQDVTRGSGGLGAYGGLEVQQARLTREMERHRETVGLLAKSVEDLSLRAKATHDPVLTITPAGKAVQIAPRKLNNMLYLTVVGLVLGFCLALLQEYLDDRVTTADDARRLLEAPVLGYIPLITQENSLLLSQHRDGRVLESYRVLRSNVQFATVDTPSSSLLITSTTPGEGKSVTAANLAVAMALDGKRVLLVDTDLRRPTAHTKFGLSDKVGLTNVLIGHIGLTEALQETGVEGLRLLASGPLPANPAELLNSRVMHELHQELKAMADVVIFDSPPMLATADAQVLASMTDGLLYVVHFGEAKKSALRHSRDLFSQAHAHLLGVIFNKMDVSGDRSNYNYGYYHYQHYYHQEPLGEGETRPRIGVELEALIAASKNRTPRNGAEKNAPALAEKEQD